ncbi:WYL domain-containing protein [bacterium]|nr:WYL domain-containing protein [bacterium]
MDSLFSEIFGCYYKVIEEIVNNSPLTEEEIKNIINENGFAESCFHLLPKLEILPFIEKKGDKYYSLLENKIKMPLTKIEKSWLKSVSQDVRFDLFSEDFDKSKLAETEPLYEQAQFKYYDKYSDGDDFGNFNYQKSFRRINEAMDNKKVVKIIYQSPKRNRVTVGHYIPLKFEFSPKDDKFRFFAARVLEGRISDYVFLNMGRVLEVRNSHENYDVELNFEVHIEKFDCAEPIEVEIYDERNAIERFMVEFSAYQKNSEFDDEEKICRTKIYYRNNDETEVLIKLLSFGPTIKVLGPQTFLNWFKYRIFKQGEMVKKEYGNYSKNT